MRARPLFVCKVQQIQRLNGVAELSYRHLESFSSRLESIVFARGVTAESCTEFARITRDIPMTWDSRGVQSPRIWMKPASREEGALHAIQTSHRCCIEQLACWCDYRRQWLCPRTSHRARVLVRPYDEPRHPMLREAHDSLRTCGCFNERDNWHDLKLLVLQGTSPGRRLLFGSRSLTPDKSGAWSENEAILNRRTATLRKQSPSGA